MSHASNNTVLILIVINTFLIFSCKMITNGVFENNNKGTDSNNGGAMAIWDKITQCTNFQCDSFAVQTNDDVVDFNSQAYIFTSSLSISKKELRLQDCTFHNVTAANVVGLIYVYNDTKIPIDINNVEVASGDVGSICIYQNSLRIDTITVTTGTADNNG